MITNTTSNIAEVLAAVKRVEDKAKNLTPVFGEIANLLLNVTEDAFDSETSPLDGKPWAELKGKKAGQKKLYASGKMQESLNVYSDNSSAVIGFNATAKGYPYPAVHQFGTEDETVEARPFLPFDDNGDITDEIKDEMLKVVEEFFEAI